MLEVSSADNKTVLKPIGKWVLTEYEKIKAQIQSKKDLTGSKKDILIDASRLEALDSAGAKLLIDILWAHGADEQSEIALQAFRPETKQLFELVWERSAKFEAQKKVSKNVELSFIERIGKVGHDAGRYLLELLSFLGKTAEGAFQIAGRPGQLRFKELVTQTEEACVKALPVVALVTFLIGVVVAYLMSMQAERYGAQILVVNGVALTMCRELSPILVAIITAGRSGSAYTAQIGAMRLNEEVDAMTALGLSPMHVLVMPRVLALIITMPLLVFLGDMVGIFGGMVIADTYLGISFTTFLERLNVALPVRSFVVGMVKAPIFAAVIAMIGCRRGLNTETNARAVGLSTTATVVESIVLVILINAGFAVFFQKLGI